MARFYNCLCCLTYGKNPTWEKFNHVHPEGNLDSWFIMYHQQHVWTMCTDFRNYIICMWLTQYIAKFVFYCKQFPVWKYLIDFFLLMVSIYQYILEIVISSFGIVWESTEENKYPMLLIFFQLLCYVVEIRVFCPTFYNNARWL